MDFVRRNKIVFIFWFIAQFFIFCRNEFHTEFSDTRYLASIKILKTVFNAVEKEANANEIVMGPIILKIDQVSFACYCEYPEVFKEELESLYNAFRLKFELERKPRKTRD